MADICGYLPCFIEQDGYPLDVFLRYIDECQPVRQRLGERMIDCLLYHDMTIGDVFPDYHRTIDGRKGWKDAEGFRVGEYYSDVRNRHRPYRVMNTSEMYVTLDFGNREGTLPKLVWRDGTESTVFEENGKKVFLSSLYVISSQAEIRN